jgi:hypothetical protein
MLFQNCAKHKSLTTWTAPRDCNFSLFSMVSSFPLVDVPCFFRNKVLSKYIVHSETMVFQQHHARTFRLVT